VLLYDKDATVEHTYVMNHEMDDVRNYNRITCGGRFIFVKGDKSYAMYEIKDTGLQRWKMGTYETLILRDISATIWDDLLVAGIYNGHIDLDEYQHKYSTLEWTQTECTTVQENVTGTDSESRVSTRDGHAVISVGQTIKVYKL
jgi:hypothetical protein